MKNEERICFGVSTLICGEIMLFKVKAHGSITERQCPEIYVFVYYCSYALKTRKKMNQENYNVEHAEESRKGGSEIN